jgi:hypothetical protein
LSLERISIINLKLLSYKIKLGCQHSSLFCRRVGNSATTKKDLYDCHLVSPPEKLAAAEADDPAVVPDVFLPGLGRFLADIAELQVVLGPML